MYQNNPNQFIPNNIPLISQAQQLQFQSQLSNLHQTAAFLQSQFMQQPRQQQQQHQQQQQQPNSVETQIKNQQLSNLQNLPELLNFFLLSNSSLNIPLSQLNPTQAAVQQQQPLQTPKTVSVSPKKSGQSQHTPRSATTGPRSIGVNISNAQTAELNSATATSVTPSATVSEQSTETSKQYLTTVSPIRSSTSTSTVTTPSSTISDRIAEDIKERTNVLSQGAKKSVQDDTALSNNVTPPSDTAQSIVSTPEATKSPSLPRRKQTNVTSPIKANPIISPTSPTVQSDSPTFSTPKKSDDVKRSLASPSTPVTGITTYTTEEALKTPILSPDKKADRKLTKKETQKSVKPKSEPEPKTSSTSDDRKPTASSAKAVPSTSLPPVPNESEIKSKRLRIKTEPYQSPTPELVLATRMSVSEANKNSVSSKDKLIIFFA